MTTYYFIRHAEKERDGTANPYLTSKGVRMAHKWVEVLGESGIEMIFCTYLVRTRETAQPLADKLGLDIEIYDLTDLYNEEFQQKTKGKTVLVIGHQDTTPAFVNRILKAQKYSYIQSGIHGNLYKVRVDDSGKAEAELFQIDFQLD